MKKILVPCDFSNHAINAFRFALDVASESNGQVHLLNVIELPMMQDTVLMPVLSFEEALLKELSENAETQFKKLKTQYPHEGIKVITVNRFGYIYKAITDYIAENEIDLVVMGTHGVSGLKEILIGSNTEKIVRNSPVPVLAIKEYPHKQSIKNIVFPNTLAKDQEDLVMHIKDLQNFFHAMLHIVWINTPTNFTGDTVTMQRLEEFVKRFMIKDYTLNIFNDPNEEVGVINFTHSIKGDLIAMGTRGRKGLAHTLSGSVTEDVVNHVDCPIWTYVIKK
jgi:nucleotide-binding universal stress UspA family protein